MDPRGGAGVLDEVSIRIEKDDPSILYLSQGEIHMKQIEVGVYSASDSQAFDIPTYLGYVEQLRNVVNKPSPSRQRLINIPCLGFMTSQETTHAAKFGWEVYR